jgi:hypothetical protein
MECEQEWIEVVIFGFFKQHVYDFSMAQVDTVKIPDGNGTVVRGGWDIFRACYNVHEVII